MSNNPKVRIDPVTGLVTTDSNQPRAFQFEQSQMLGDIITGIDLDDFNLDGVPVINRFGEESLRHQEYDDQSAFEYIAKGLGRVGTSFLGEVAKIPGYIGGGIIDIGEGLTGQGWDLSALSNNMYVNGITQLQEYIDESALALVKSPDFQDRSLMGQMLDPAFWATEGSQGLGFLLSMLAPGQFLRALKVGSAVSGKLAKASEFTKLGKILNKRLKHGSLNYDRLANNIDSGSAVLINTFTESAAEASGMYSEVYEKSLQSGYSHEEASSRAAKAATNVFSMNVPLLLASNFFVEKYIMNGFSRFAGKKGFSRITNKVITGEEQVAKLTGLQKAKRLGVNVAASTAQEGFFEEGIQTSMGQVIGENPEAGFLEVFDKYMENVEQMFSANASTDAKDFGRAAILGGILGSGMAGIRTFSEAKAEDEALFGRKDANPGFLGRFINKRYKSESEGLLKSLQNAYADTMKTRKEFMEFDDAGNPIGFKEGVVENMKDGAAKDAFVNYYHDLLFKYNGDTEAAEKDMLNALNKVNPNNKKKNKEFFKALSINYALTNEEALLKAKNNMDTRYFLPFLQQEGGLKLLKEHIDSMVEASAQRYFENTGAEMTTEQKENLKSELKTKADKYNDFYNTAINQHSKLVRTVNPNKDIELSSDEERKLFADSYNDFMYHSMIAKFESLVNSDFYAQRVNDLSGIIDPIVQEGTARREESINQAIEDYKMMASDQGVELEQLEEYQKFEKDASEFTYFLSKEEQKKYQENLKQREEYEKALEEEQERYETNSDTRKLEKAWKEKWESITNPDEDVQQPTQEITREQFWDMIINSGYSVDTSDEVFKLNDVLHFKYKNSKIIVRKGKDGKWYMIKNGKAELFPTVSEFYKKHKGVTLMTKGEVAKERAKRKQEEIDNLVNRQILAQVESLNRIILDRKAQSEEREQRLKDANQRVKELHEIWRNTAKELKAIKYKRGVKSKRKALKDTIKEVKKELRDLNKEIERLENDKSAIDEHIKVLSEWREIAKTSRIDWQSSRNILSEEIGIEVPEETIQELNKQSDEISQRLNDLYTYKKHLEDYLRILEALEVESLLGNAIRNAESKLKNDPELLMEFFRTRGFPGLNADIYDLRKTLLNFINDSSSNKLSKVLRALDEIAEIENGFDPSVNVYSLSMNLIDFLNDNADVLNADNSIQDDIVFTKQALKALEQQEDLLLSELNLVDMRKKLNILDKNINRIMKHQQDVLAELDALEATKDDLSNENDNTFNPSAAAQEQFYQNALPNEMLHTTGVSIRYDVKGEDIYVTDEDGEQYPLSNLTKYQKAWFLFLDKNKISDYSIMYHVADYDASDPLNKAIAENNPPPNRTDKDVFAFLVDSEGNVLMSDEKGNLGKGDIPLFTSIRRPKSMFPENNLPKMNMFALTNMFLKEVANTSVSRKAFEKPITKIFSKSIQEKIAAYIGVEEIPETMTLDDISKSIISWGSDKYEEIYYNIINSKTTLYSNIDVVTNGFPVRLLDKDSKVKLFNPKKSLDLKFRKSKNFDMTIVDRKGNVKVGGVTKTGMIPGTVILRKRDTGQLVPMLATNLQESDIQIILDILEFAGENPDMKQDIFLQDLGIEMDGYLGIVENGKLTKRGKSKGDKLDPSVKALRVFPKRNERLSLLTLMMNYGVQQEGKLGKNDIFISKGRVVFGGGKTLSLKKVKDSSVNGELIEFLTNQKRQHVNRKVLTSLAREFFYPEIKNGKIKMVKYNSYEEFLFNTGRLKTVVPDRKTLEDKGLPQHAQKNLGLSLPSSGVIKKKTPKNKETNTIPQGFINLKDIIKRKLASDTDGQIVEAILSIFEVWIHISEKYKGDIPAEIEYKGETIKVGGFKSWLKPNGITTVEKLSKFLEYYEQQKTSSPEETSEGQEETTEKPQTGTETTGKKPKITPQVEGKDEVNDESNDEVNDVMNRLDDLIGGSEDINIKGVDRMSNANRTLNEMIDNNQIEKNCD